MIKYTTSEITDWVPSFSLLEIEEDCLSCFMQSITEVDTDPSEMFVSFTVTLPNERLLCVYASKGIAPGNKWLGGVSMKDYKIIWK